MSTESLNGWNFNEADGSYESEEDKLYVKLDIKSGLYLQIHANL